MAQGRLGILNDMTPSVIMEYSVLYILLSTIIIIIQECAQALEICKCLWSLSCGGVPNMLLVLSITFDFH